MGPARAKKGKPHGKQPGKREIAADDEGFFRGHGFHHSRPFSPRILPGALLFWVLLAIGTGFKRSGNIILGLVLLLLGWLFPGCALGALLLCIIVVVAGKGLPSKRHLRAGS